MESKKEIIQDIKIRLNLIPPERRKEIEDDRRFKMVARTEMALAAIVVVFFFLLLSFRYILNLNLVSNFSAQEKRQKTEQYEKIKNYDSRFKEINSEIKDIITIRNNQIYWSNMFAKLSGLIFPGISVKSLSTSDYSIFISGLADTREDLIFLKEKLGEDGCFSDIDLPLSNLVDKNNIEFQIVFKIKSDCLKKK